MNYPKVIKIFKNNGSADNFTLKKKKIYKIRYLEEIKKREIFSVMSLRHNSVYEENFRIKRH